MQNKINVLFFCDVPNWAFHNIANFVIENFSTKYNFYIDFSVSDIFDDNSEIKLKWHQTLRKEFRKWKIFKKYGNPLSFRKVRTDNSYDVVILFEAFFERDLPWNVKYKYLVKGIYTDSYPPFRYSVPEDYPIENFVKRFFSNADAVICGCQNSFKRYSPFVKNIFYVNAPLDDKLFIDTNRVYHDNKFIIGWTGNPERKNKGYYSHILPTIERLQKNNKDIIFKTKFSGNLRDLAKFYSDVDVVLIASSEDTGPSMFMEASLSGVPSISTRVGWPLEIIQDNINGIFVDRDIDSLYSAVMRLYENRKLLRAMSQRIRQDFINTLGREVMVRKWQRLFNALLLH